MKKRTVLRAAVAFLLLLPCIGWVFWRIPVHVPEDITPQRVSCITVFDGSSGTHCRVEDGEAIAAICQNISEAELRRDGFSGNTDGIGFSLSFYGEGDEPLCSLSVGSEHTLTYGAFVYKTDCVLCFEYLRELLRELSE